ncbi:hypothetical protein [Leucobacter sp. GX24907]
MGVPERGFDVDVSEEERRAATRARGAWRVLSMVLLIEVIGGAVLLWSVLSSSFAATEDPFAQRLSILLAAVFAFIWIAATLYGAAARRAGWARGSAITIHVLIFAAGTGVLQGIVGTPLLGWVLVVLSLLGFFAAVLARPDVRGSERGNGLNSAEG